MAAGKIAVQANDTRVYTITPEDGAAGNVSITLPKEGGTVLTTNTAVPVDAVPTNGSMNPVSSNGVFDALVGKVSKTGDETIAGVKTFSNNLVFTSGTKITGDFSNATLANRTLVQSNAVNGYTSVDLVPNGTSQVSQLQAANSSDPTNASVSGLGVNANDSRLFAGKNGTGTYLPLAFYTNGSERMRIDTAGNVLVTGSGGLGYGTGSGGTVTQLTSKSTAVTLNKPCGLIYMNNASLAAGASVSFVVNNTSYSFATRDLVLLHSEVYGNNYRVEALNYSTNYFQIRVTNITGGSLSEALEISFAIIKGAIS